MTTKVCPNRSCRAYAHFVYTVAVRCVLCRCDLVAAHSIAANPSTPRTDASLIDRQPAKSAGTHAAR
jgi:hypothetical protein